MISVATHKRDAAVRARALVAAENVAMRVRLCALLEAQTDLQPTATTDRAGRDLESVGSDLLIAHCETIDVDAAVEFERLRRARPGLRIVAVCATLDGRSSHFALDGVIDGLVLVNELESGLAPTVAAVLAGQVVLPREVCERMRKPALSFRERQVLALVALGFTNGEIGRRLYLAESTVKSHLSSAFSKLGVSSRSEAAALILDPDNTVGAAIMEIATASDAFGAIARV